VILFRSENTRATHVIERLDAVLTGFSRDHGADLVQTVRVLSVMSRTP
jgi:hypothetical protein